jgi:hypothetical protein
MTLGRPAQGFILNRVLEQLLACRIANVVSPAELEHRLGLDREEMHLGVGRGVEAIELAERCAGSLTPTDMITDG